MNSTKAQNRFGNRTVLITGGAGDFGKHCGLRMASENAHVILLDINEQALTQSKSEIEKANQSIKVQYFVCDVTDSERVENVIREIEEQGTRIDYCFNNAGYQGQFSMTQDYDDDDFKKVISINVYGVFNVLKQVSRHMIDHGIKGSIVNTASKAATNCPPNMIAYASSKGAVWSMTQTAAKDLAPFGIRVNSVSPAFIGPGFMWTRQTELQAQVNSQYYDKDPKIVEQQMIGSTPMRRVGSVEEVIGVVTYLFSDDSSYITAIDHTVTGGLI